MREALYPLPSVLILIHGMLTYIICLERCNLLEENTGFNGLFVLLLNKCIVYCDNISK
jgi:hypothetical protein